MKVVGRAMSAIGERMLIIPYDAAQLPQLYSKVTDQKMKPVGKILDLFGNVKALYAAVLCRGKCTVQPKRSSQRNGFLGGTPVPCNRKSRREDDHEENVDAGN